jgi:hypothetical protein
MTAMEGVTGFGVHTDERAVVCGIEPPRAAAGTVALARLDAEARPASVAQAASQL